MRILEGRRAANFVKKLEQRGPSALARVEKQVRRIVDDIRKNGDHALRRYAEKWDGLKPKQPLRVPQAEMEQALRAVSEEFRQALQIAATNIRQHCEAQKPEAWQREFMPGVEVGQVVRPIDSAGCYVPGGRYPLPSTLLMTVIPAQVAGVERICVVSPRPAQETLAAAAFLGVREVYRIGGAQAIAALAYGTKSVSRVTKIVGPGNLFVTAAKKQVAIDCAIDFLAGPTEAVIVSDNGDASFIAADLAAQAEHDPEAPFFFITTGENLAARAANELKAASAANETTKTSQKNNAANQKSSHLTSSHQI